jgi:hypothetical protein
MNHSPKVILINRMLGYDGLNIALKGHSGKAYGKLSRYSPEHKCHVVELSLAEYEAAREDIFKKTRHSMSGFLLWEPQIVLGEAASAVTDFPARGSDAKNAGGNIQHPTFNAQHPMGEAAEAVGAETLEGNIPIAPTARRRDPTFPRASRKLGSRRASKSDASHSIANAGGAS